MITRDWITEFLAAVCIKLDTKPKRRLATRRESRSNWPMPHKSALTSKIVERDFPHCVIMPVPENGFGRQLYVFEDWHRKEGIVSQRGRRIRGDREKISWCFANAAIADKFQKEFGGERHDFLPSRRKQVNAGLEKYST